MTNGIREELNGWIEETLKTTLMQGVKYDFTVSILGANHDGSLVLGYTFVFTCPSPVIGQGLVYHAQLHSVSPEKSVIENLTTTALNELTKLKVQTLRMNNSGSQGFINLSQFKDM